MKNKFEEMPNNEKNESAKKAIITYLSAKDEFLKREITDEDRNNYEYDAFQNEESLAGGGDGLRLGAPGYQHTKLKFIKSSPSEQEYYFVYSNGMDEQKFKEWERFVGKKFEENELPFKYYSQ